MTYNHRRREGEGYRRGEGPGRIRVSGGVGKWPQYDEGCGDYNVYLSMTSVLRLRMMSYLCVKGPMRAPALAAALGASRVSVWAALWGLQSTWAVEGRPAEIQTRSRSKSGGCHAMLWCATETGRKWLWRYGWVTRRIGYDWYWTCDNFQGRQDVMPWDVLRDHAQPSLLRPVAMAVARHLLHWGPLQAPRIAEDLGLRRSVVEQYIRRWRLQWWLTQLDGGLCKRSYFCPDCEEPASQWSFNNRGEEAMERHADALRWASQTCGYVPPEDDAFLRDEDMVNYVKACFYRVGPGGERMDA